MIIDVFKQGTELYDKLAEHNETIYKEYDENIKEGTSPWFDPRAKDVLHLSKFASCIPEQNKPEYCLSLYHPNYLSLFLINHLFADRKDVLIEDFGCGMGKFVYYLNKLGFTNFSVWDNFTQLNKELWEGLMKHVNPKPTLNHDNTEPIIINSMGAPFEYLTRDVVNKLEKAELVCFYNNQRWEEVSLEYLQSRGYVFLCKDRADFSTAYCRRDKYEEFKSKLGDYMIKEKDDNPIPQYMPSFGYEEPNAVTEYMAKYGYLTEFKETEAFQNMLAEKTGSKYCYMTPNGTLSLSLALKAMGVGAGTSVLVPSLSMIATATSAEFIGCNVVFGEIEKETLCLDVDNAIESIKMYDIKAVVYVSFNGRQSKNIEKLVKYCNDNNVLFIEDAAQSLGSTLIEADVPIRSYSFSMPKIITTGQGGCLMTDNDEIALKIKKIRDFGRENGGNDIHDDFGINCKFTDLQAVVGIQQLHKLPRRIEFKKSMFNKYKELLKDCSQVEMLEHSGTPWFVDVYVNDRFNLKNYLDENGIGTRLMYPPLYSQKCYDLNSVHEVTEDYSSRGLWLPSSLNLRDCDIEFTCKKIKEFYGGK